MTEHPTSPPQLRPRPRLSRAQRIGLPVMLLIPVLALVNVFGERHSATEMTAGDLRVVARVPSRLRYRQRMSLDVSVTNVGGRPLDSVRGRIDTAYLDRFSGAATEPKPLPDDVIELGWIPPRGSARLRVTLEGDRAGAIRGTLHLWDARGDTVRIPLMSVVFP